MYNRFLDITLPPKQSAFLWGARKTGKSTYLRQHFPESLTYNFLKTDILLKYLKQPYRFREELLAKPSSQLRSPVILDEVQKVPALLDEVHFLIEEYGFNFILCGSSARKLKRGQANLLGGRAWRYELFPLVYPEIPEFDLLQALNRGLIPDHYNSDQYALTLESYITDYLKEEILDEGLTRNMPAFSRFLDAVGFSNAELVNYTNIAADCGVDSKTVKEYFHILEDTLLGYMIAPFKRRQDRNVISKTPKFYFFDVGVAQALSKVTIGEMQGEVFGKAFEHFVMNQLVAYRSYRHKREEICYWRNRKGLEVDCVVGDADLLIEIKSGATIRTQSLHGLKACREMFPHARTLVVSTEREKRVTSSGFEIYPWELFLQELWDGRIW